jgi:DNA polymerase V
MKMILDVLKETGITATCGIGSNLYLAKIAMDIFAKHMKEDENGVRIATLDEYSYRKFFWTHTPITDFWRIGSGYAKRLSELGLFTMGDIAKCSLGKENDFYNEKLLYKTFGVNAKLLIDHAWGYEPCQIKEIKEYKPLSSSISQGQVLTRPYKTDEAKLVTCEMADLLSLDLVSQNLVTSQIVLTLVYDIENLKNKDIKNSYKGDFCVDHYGRTLPSSAHGTINLKAKTSSSNLIIDATKKLFDKIANPKLLIRKIYIVANNVITNEQEKETIKFEQLSLFENYENLEKEEKQEKERLEKEKKTQDTLLKIKEKYGKNSILRGINLQEGATAKERNKQIGGHRA